MKSSQRKKQIMGKKREKKRKEGKSRKYVGSGWGKNKKNYELKTLSWGWVGFHPIQKNPKKS
jgi:hypothetical protein